MLWLYTALSSHSRLVRFLSLTCIYVSSLCVLFFFFFFKQKTAYEMLRSLVGSEMCIRDSWSAARRSRPGCCSSRCSLAPCPTRWTCCPSRPRACLLYTSDAADDLLCVDLGGRRIIKKKNQYIIQTYVIILSTTTTCNTAVTLTMTHIMPTSTP